MKRLNVAIVGGGPACKAIMDIILDERLKQLRMKLLGVACTNPNAVGYRYAQEKGIYTTRDYHDFFKFKDLDMIIELAGRNEVADEIIRAKPDNVRVMDNVSARLFWDIFQVEEEKFVERKRTEKVLREMHSDLELRVKERTSELSESNILLKKEIAEHKQAQEALEESRQRLSTIFNSVQAGILIIDVESHVIVDVNPVAVEMVGRPKKEIVGKLSHKFVCPDEKGECLITGLGQNIDKSESVLLTAHNKVMPIVKTVAPVMLNGRKHLIESFFDITDLKRVQEDLCRKNEELENFVSVVAHDLKTPIIAVQGFSSRLAKKCANKLDKKAEDYLAQIQASARRMEIFVSDLLSLARAGQVVGTRQNVSIPEVLKDIISSLEPQLRDKEIKVVIADDLPTVSCDKERISEVFENLLTNAIKFSRETKDAEIRVGYKSEGAFHKFYIEDNGIGIDPKDHSRIFEIFHRTKEANGTEGTGIGLAIVDKIIKELGGKLWVESEKGEGATFYFKLPESS